MDNFGKQATINCEGSFIDNNGQRIVFDSTYEKAPVTFTVGAGEVIPGIDEAVAGMQAGQSGDFTFPPEKAFGAYDKSLCENVPMENLPEGEMIRIGGYLPFISQDGKRGIGQIIKIFTDDVLMDFNHPFAGKTISYHIDVLSIN